MKVMSNVFDQDKETYDRDPSKNTFSNFLLSSGLYESYEVSKENIQDLIDVLNGNVRIDIYCKDCGESRVFSMKQVLFPFENSQGDMCMRSLGKELSWKQHIQGMRDTPFLGEKSSEKEWHWTDCETKEFTRVMVFQFQCAMNGQHYTDYIVRADGNSLVKIGQFPSVADLSFPELEVYKKVLTKEDRKEFRRAIGLYASGIGVGSFVYLRRIFERMIQAAKNIAIQDGVELEGFEKAHVEEKIKMLKDYLPKALDGNTIFYGIVSKGIHELSEDECIIYFPVLRDFLFLIMRQWEQQRQEKETEKQLAASLSKIAQQIK